MPGRAWQFYLPISTVNFIHNFSDNDLLFNGVFEFLILWVLVDFQVSSLERLPNTKGEKKCTLEVVSNRHVTVRKRQAR